MGSYRNIPEQPQEYLSNYGNTWVATRIPGDLEAGDAHLGSHMNTWADIGIPVQLHRQQESLFKELVIERDTSGRKQLCPAFVAAIATA